jgi:Mg-chelatase subunit ChlD
VRAVADFEDGVGFTGRLTFPIPRVTVTRPEVEHHTVFLPVLYRQQCRPVHTDVVLAFDTSSSMLEATTPGGPSKLAAAVQGGRVFLAQLRLPEDRVALVAFNGGATLVQPLTGDQAALVRAMDQLPKGSGTRIDLGLDVARGALKDVSAERKPVIILLTDGIQTGAPADAARAAAADARAAGISIFTIALGADADAVLLAQVAGDARRAFSAATEANLAAIYREIAGLIPCD